VVALATKTESRSKDRKEADDAKAKAAKEADKAAEEKADKIADLPDVETVAVEIDDSDAIVMFDDDWFRLSPAQVHYLAKSLTHVSNDLHIHSNA
jgi:hypothetical protein